MNPVSNIPIGPLTNEPLTNEPLTNEPLTKAQHALSVNSFAKNQEGVLTRVLYAVASLFQRIDFVNRRLQGSAQHLEYAARNALSAPTDQKKLEAFYSAFKVRVTRLGLDLQQETPETVKAALEQVLQGQGKQMANLPDVLKGILERIALIEKDAFVDSMSKPEVLPAVIEGETRAASARIAALFGVDADQTEADIRTVLFARLGSALNQASTIKPVVDVQSRVKAEEARLEDLQNRFTEFRSQVYTSEFSQIYQVQPTLLEAVKKAESALDTTVLSLNQNLSSLRASLAQLLLAADQHKIDLDSEEAKAQKTFLLELTVLTLDVEKQRSHQSMREVAAKLDVLEQFLNLGDGRIVKGPISQKLAREKSRVQTEITQLRKLISTFNENKQDLFVAEKAVKEAQQKRVFLNELDEQRKTKTKELAALLADQEALEAHATQVVEHQRTCDSIVKGDRLVNKIARSFARQSLPLPEAPEAPQLKTGGVQGLIEQEIAETQATARRLYDYLNPNKKPDPVDLTPTKKGWFGGLFA